MGAFLVLCLNSFVLSWDQKLSQLPRLCNPERDQRGDDNGGAAAHLLRLVPTFWENHRHCYQSGCFSDNCHHMLLLHWSGKSDPSCWGSETRSETTALQKSPFTETHVFGRHKTWALRDGNTQQLAAKVTWKYKQGANSVHIDGTMLPFILKNREITRPQTCSATACQCFWAQRWFTTHPPTRIQLGTTIRQVHSSLVWTTSPPLPDPTKSNLSQDLWSSNSSKSSTEQEEVKANIDLYMEILAAISGPFPSQFNHRLWKSIFKCAPWWSLMTFVISPYSLWPPKNLFSLITRAVHCSAPPPIWAHLQVLSLLHCSSTFRRDRLTLLHRLQPLRGQSF